MASKENPSEFQQQQQPPLYPSVPGGPMFHPFRFGGFHPAQGMQQPVCGFPGGGNFGRPGGGPGCGFWGGRRGMQGFCRGKFMKKAMKGMWGGKHQWHGGAGAGGSGGPGCGPKGGSGRRMRFDISHVKEEDYQTAIEVKVKGRWLYVKTGMDANNQGAWWLPPFLDPDSMKAKINPKRKVLVVICGFVQPREDSTDPERIVKIETMGKDEDDPSEELCCLLKEKCWKGKKDKKKHDKKHDKKKDKKKHGKRKRKDSSSSTSSSSSSSSDSSDGEEAVVVDAEMA